jgi:hypothetical protein
MAFLGQRPRRAFDIWITIDTQCCIFLQIKGLIFILIDGSFRRAFWIGASEENKRLRRGGHFSIFTTQIRSIALRLSNSREFFVQHHVRNSADISIVENCVRPVWALLCPPRVHPCARETQGYMHRRSQSDGGTTDTSLVSPRQQLEIAGALNSINKSCRLTTSNPLDHTDRLADRVHTEASWNHISAMASMKSELYQE